VLSGDSIWLEILRTSCTDDGVTAVLLLPYLGISPEGGRGVLLVSTEGSGLGLVVVLRVGLDGRIL